MLHLFNHKSKCKYSKEVNKYTKTHCLEWCGGLDKNRPVMRVDGRDKNSYVFACEFGQKRQKKVCEITRHLCNNKICCEPTHLKFGTAKENAADALRFTESKRFIINYEKAREIREKYSRGGGVTCKDLAGEFKINHYTLYNVLRNKSWVE